MKLLKPLKGNPPITQHFGENPQNYPLTHGHNGIDFGVPNGTPAYASVDGLIVFAEMDPETKANKKTGYGNEVRIQAADCLVIYGHLQEFACKRDDRVKAGDLIGYTDNTGNSTGPHLHFEVRMASGVLSCVDPEAYLVDVITPSRILFKVKITAAILNKRVGPGTKYSLIGHLAAGDLVDVQDIAGDSCWFQGVDGNWIAGRYLGEDYAEIV
jgi:murein DD-endopeptidase MepM/ murein hydrolase activator NlpD